MWSPLTLVFIVFGLSELTLSLTRRSRDKTSVRDRRSLGLIWVVVGLSILLAFGFAASMPRWPHAEVTRYIGIALMLFGMALRWYAIRYLGRWFTVNVAIAADQRLIDSGPYRHVRHPSYTGALLVFLGMGLGMGNVPSLLVLVLPALAAFGWRIHVEETVLAAAFGSQWQAYAARTKRLIPGIY
jgi:protein-S-isoprenylcysteine O-methyltransferase